MTDTARCPSCDRTVRSGATRCLFCGAMLAELPRCTDCDRPLAAEGARCLYCGDEKAQAGPSERRAPATTGGGAPASTSPPAKAPLAPATRGGELTLFATPRQRALLLGLALAVTATGIGLCVWAYPDRGRVDDELRGRFASHMDRYAAAYPAASAAEPHIRGDLLPIGQFYDTPPDRPTFTEDVLAAHTDPIVWHIHELYDQLPSSLVADDPEDVGTVARIHCANEIVGVYVQPDGRQAGNAYREVCTLTLVDLTEGRVIDERRFPGSMPASSTDGFTDLRGSDPLPEVAAYLEGLPRT